MFGRKREKTLEPGSVRRAVVILAVIVVVSFALRIYQERRPPEAETALFILGSGSITAEIADTPEKKELGLGERDSLPARHGMYFPFAADRKWIFWMKGMRFPIDAIWIRDGIVVDVTHDAQPPSEGAIERFSPKEPADAVLEINAGEAEELGVEPGDAVRIRR